MSKPKVDIHLLNKDLPYVMHIDLNSCFAIIEQQANRLLRGRPVGVAAYDTPRGFVLAASYEAKAKGIKLGVNVEQARTMCPGIVIMMPDPAKYREAHKRFKELLLQYTPDVAPKSIDEFVLDLTHAPALKQMRMLIADQAVPCISPPGTRGKGAARHDARLAAHDSQTEERRIHNEAMLRIARDIKKHIAESLGEWVTVNVGIGTNRFLAKYAAGFDKPDGMTLIDHSNLRSFYDGMHLVDLPGINVRYRARLRAAGIFTPIDFLEADLSTLKKRVFKSIGGYYWYLRLRGHEIDKVEFSRKSIGHQYALKDKTTDMDKLERLLIKLCEKTGRRLRKNNFYASGIHLYLGFVSDQPIYDGPASFENMHTFASWHHGEKLPYRLYSTQDIYDAAKRLLHSAEIAGRVKIMSVHVFELAPWEPEQLSLFESYRPDSDGQTSKAPLRTIESSIRQTEALKRISDAVDAINNRYGEFVITPALMMDMQGTILDRIAFGQVHDL